MGSEMQAAYLEYMLGKSAGDVPKSPVGKSPGADNDRSGKKKKAHRPILRAVQGRFEEWKDTNSKLEAVLRSIANLRNRIYWESSFLNLRREQKEQPVWGGSGFRSGFSNDISCNSLKKEDIHLALDHDLLQHERMLSAVRTLVASLAQVVDEIGRRLDDWMLHNIMDQDDLVVGDAREQDAFEIFQEVYSLLASDLYSKQNIATRVFESCHDGVLEGTDASGQGHSNFKSDPRDVIKKSLKELSKSENRNLLLSLVEKLLSLP